MTEITLPSFDSPPVRETVLGVQFSPLPGLTIAHLGAYWASLGEQWRDVSDAPPSEAMVESFGADSPWLSQPGWRFQISRDLNPRIQVRNAAKDRMIQIQNGKFLYNWTRSGTAEYIRYPVLKEEFEKHFSNFNSFLSRHRLPEASVNQWEIVYVNQIERGTVWETPEQWPQLCSLFQSPRIDQLALKFESQIGEWLYEIPPQQGRLRIRARHGYDTASMEMPRTEALFLTLIARGEVNNKIDYRLGLDLGRDRIERIFASMTSQEAHQFWRRTQ